MPISLGLGDFALVSAPNFEFLVCVCEWHDTEYWKHGHCQCNFITM